MSRILVIVFTVLVVGCGGAAATPVPRASTGGAQPSTAQSTTGPLPTQASAATPANPGAPAGNAKALVTALVPPGSTQLNAVEVGGNYTVQLTSQSSMSDLQSFFDQKIPTLGITQTGKTTVGDNTIYAFTNPDGGITISSDGSGGILITISAGASS